MIPKYGHSAVERNRLKRRVREHVRQLWIAALTPPRASSIDVVVRATPDAYAASAATLRDEMSELRRRLERAAASGLPHGEPSSRESDRSPNS